MNSGIQLDKITLEAVQEIASENHRALVEARKAELRSRSNRTLWQRVLSKLPFTITIERKRK